MENKTIQKPIMVQIQEFKNGISTLIQESKLPIFIIEPIIKEFAQDANLVLQQYSNAQIKEYNKQLAESQKEEIETVEEK